MSNPPYDQPLNTSLRQIRLLKILPEPHPVDGRLQCYFTIKSLFQDPEELNYQALSYMWGKPDDHEFNIWVNRALVPVRQNLLCAMRVLRANNDTIKLPIWIDALCIDQQNLSERGHQVDLMGVIYRGARHVIAWLGTRDRQELENRTLDVQQTDPREIPVAGLNFVAQVNESIAVLPAPINVPKVRSWMQEFFSFSSTWDGLQDLATIFSNTYWERLWVLQEVCLARRLLLFVGRRSIEWNNLHEYRAAYRFGWFDVLFDLSRMMESPVRHLYHYSQISLDLQKITTSRPWRLDGYMRSDIMLKNETLLSTTLVEALELSKNCLCEDKRDKFYGVLGLTTDIDDFDVPVDYSLTLFQVYECVIQKRLKELGRDYEELAFYEDSDDDELSPYPERHILNLSRALQRSLLGPAFELSAFEEMASGRAVMLTRSTADLEYLKIQGEDLGKVIGCFTTVHDLPHLPHLKPEKLNSGSEPAILVLEKKIQSSLTVTDSSSDDSWASFCFDLSIGCELGMDESATRNTNSLTMFVTDSGNVGIAPDVIMPGDHVWGHESRCPGLAILRGEEGNYRMISRACLANDWIRPGISAVDSEWRPARNKGIKEMTTGFNLADLQILTCPLRGTKDLEQKFT